MTEFVVFDEAAKAERGRYATQEAATLAAMAMVEADADLKLAVISMEQVPPRRADHIRPVTMTWEVKPIDPGAVAARYTESGGAPSMAKVRDELAAARLGELTETARSGLVKLAQKNVRARVTVTGLWALIGLSTFKREVISGADMLALKERRLVVLEEPMRGEPEICITDLGRMAASRFQSPSDNPHAAQHQDMRRDFREVPGQPGASGFMPVNMMGDVIARMQSAGKLTAAQLALCAELAQAFYDLDGSQNMAMDPSKVGGGSGAGDPLSMRMINAGHVLREAEAAVRLPDLWRGLRQALTAYTSMRDIEKRMGWAAHTGKQMVCVALDLILASREQPVRRVW